MAVAPSSLSRLRELQAHGERKRSAAEVRIPGNGIRPDRWVAFGEMPTCPSNNAQGAPPRAWIQTAAGRIPFQERRARRADGSRGAWLQPPAGLYREEPADLLKLQAAQDDVAQALASATGQLVLAPQHRVRHVDGRVMVVPHKGAVVKYASAQDVAEALALGLL